MREKVGKSRNAVFSQWFGAPEGSKSRLAKAAGAEPAGQMRDEKLHAVVARSTFRSQNVENTPAPDHFWQLRCRKSARCCGAKHISKSKCTKHTSVGPLLEVAMSKKCTALWREAYLEVKMRKAHHGWSTFGSRDVEKVHAVVARSTFPSQNVKTTRGSDHFLEVQMSKKCTPLWREVHFKVKMLKTLRVRNTFGSSDLEKVHAVVARSTFGSQTVKNTRVRTTLGSSDLEKVHAVAARSTFQSQTVKNTRGSDHFWKFRSRKSARRCGAKHIWKSNC